MNCIFKKKPSVPACKTLEYGTCPESSMAAVRHLSANGVPAGWSEYLDFEHKRGGQCAEKDKFQHPASPSTEHQSSVAKKRAAVETLPRAEDRIYSGTMRKKVIASKSTGSRRASQSSCKMLWPAFPLQATTACLSKLTPESMFSQMATSFCSVDS